MFPTSKDHDQHAAYDLTRHGATSQHPADPRVRAAFNESLFIGIMPSYLFASGHTFMVQRLHEVSIRPPFSASICSEVEPCYFLLLAVWRALS